MFLETRCIICPRKKFISMCFNLVKNNILQINPNTTFGIVTTTTLWQSYIRSRREILNMYSRTCVISKGNTNAYCHGLSWDGSSFSFKLRTIQYFYGNMNSVLNIFLQLAIFMFSLDAQNHIFNQTSHWNFGCSSQKASTFSQKGTCAHRTHSYW